MKLVTPENATKLPSVVLQVYASQRMDLSSVVKRFKPHVTLLFLRHPAACLASLTPKPNAMKAGSPEVKLKAIEEALLLTSPLMTPNKPKLNSSEFAVKSISAVLGKFGSRRLLEETPDFFSPKIDAVFTFEDFLTNHR